MADDELTLEELASRTGVEPRTLRSWVAEGLLAPPLRSGRGARYPASNETRALAVRALKDFRGLSLADIGRRFMMATEQEIQDWASQGAPRSASHSSARDYLRDLQARGKGNALDANGVSRQKAPGFDDKVSPPSYPPGKEPFSKPMTHRRRRDAIDADQLAGIERLLVQLEDVLGGSAPRRSRGAIWTRITVTPDLELSVRGDLEPHERILFEQLADQFRAILTGRTRP